MVAREVTKGGWPEKKNALAQLTLDLIRHQDALRAAARAITHSRRLIASEMGKRVLEHLALDAELLARGLEPIRAYAWCELKRLGGGKGNDESRDGARAEADRGVPLD